MSSKVVDLLSSSVADDPKMLAAAEMLDVDFSDLEKSIKFVAPWQCLESQTEPALSYLAAECAVDVWEPDWSDEKKRAVLDISLLLHRKKGTALAVTSSLESMGFLARHLNWPEFGGDPFTFRVEVDVLDQPVTDQVKDAVGLSIEENKAGRSHLDDLKVYFGSVGHLEIGGYCTFGRVVELLPYVEEFEEPQGDLRVGGGVVVYRTINIGVDHG